MLNFIDSFLNRTTMYRLVLYILSFFFLAAFGLSFFQLLPYTPFELLQSAIIILAVSWITNTVFAWAYEAPANVESVYITAFILIFLISPPHAGNYPEYLPLAVWASVWAMASKYIFALGKKHIFNPVALAVVITALTINAAASWWIGTSYMLPFVIIGGSLIVRKIKRADLVWSFLITALVTTMLGLWLTKGLSPIVSFNKTVFDSALFFFALIMLTEPLTTPPTRWMRIIYGALVGFLFSPVVHIGNLYSTPEIALILGNIFSYIVSPKEKLILRLKQIFKIGADTYEFTFSPDKKFTFAPGQYMEWTLAQRETDSRGNRRYFTLASSPTEADVKLGVKFYPEPSSYKNKMLSMQPGDTIVASQIAGEFILPEDKGRKLAFIAGGIGVTPFRSMIQYLLDMRDKRNIVMLYSNKTAEEIVYKDVFDKASAELGIKTIYTITHSQEIPSGLQARLGMIDGNMIAYEIPDYKERMFYISGPHGMVVAFKATLESMGVKRSQIITDYFPGF